MKEYSVTKTETGFNVSVEGRDSGSITVKRSMKEMTVNGKVFNEEDRWAIEHFVENFTKVETSRQERIRSCLNTGLKI